MPKPRTGNPPGRPKGTREADSHAYVRMTSEERKILERAIDRKMQTASSGVRISVSGLMLDAGLAEALRLLMDDEIYDFMDGQVFEAEEMTTSLGLSGQMKYRVLAVLRDMASRGLLMQHSAASFFRPKKK